VGAVLDGRYKIIEPIAKGAMGIVYRAERLKLGRAVAIKVLHEALPEELGSRQRFEVEAKAMAQLEHPHCVHVFDVGLYEDKPYIVMELVRGASLLDLLAQGRFAPARAVSIVRQILSGLTHAHELGIIHRDIKPANVVVGEKAGLGEHVRILDFGLARSQAHSTGITAGFAVGTPSYMAPEQCCGMPVDARADIYACGVVLFELLTGRKPFVADDPIAIVQHHLSQPPPRMDSVVADDFGELEVIVARALAKKPADRYQTAAEMAAALEAAITKRPSLGVIEPSETITVDPTDVVTSAPIQYPNTLPGMQPVKARTDELPKLAEDSAVAPLPKKKPPPSRWGVAIAILGLAAVGVGVARFMLGGGSHAAAPPGEAALAATRDDASDDPAASIIDHAERLAADGRTDLALDLATKSRRDYPTSAGLAYLAGKLYFAKLYWHDGVTGLREAIRLDPRLRGDPELIKTVLRGFIVTPDYNEMLANFLHDDIGPAAMPYLEETSRDHPNARVRARASAELRRYVVPSRE
jgi:serine/threonine-protein kinase